MKLRNVPLRLATGAYIAHTGWEKWHGDEDRAAGVHGMASGAYPFLSSIKSTDFLKALSIGEMVVGATLLAPFVPPAVAGAALTGFSAPWSPCTCGPAHSTSPAASGRRL